MHGALRIRSRPSTRGRNHGRARSQKMRVNQRTNAGEYPGVGSSTALAPALLSDARVRSLVLSAEGAVPFTSSNLNERGRFWKTPGGGRSAAGPSDYRFHS